MLDIIVSGGTVVLPSGPEPADIGAAGKQQRKQRRRKQPTRR